MKLFGNITLEIPNNLWSPLYVLLCSSKTIDEYLYYTEVIFFLFEETSTHQKAHFVGSGEGVKPRLSQALTRGARPDSNSRPVMQISNPLPSRYALGDQWSSGRIVYRGY